MAEDLEEETEILEDVEEETEDVQVWDSVSMAVTRPPNWQQVVGWEP